ncbi:MAG: co-chaperone DjlA [Candidatus Obscuribacterales bacterium]|nr:co-chaperone DjlA [Steroidobacteraceae bacterium]
MAWYGKAIGALLGAIIGRSPLAIFLGLIIGHYFDLQTQRSRIGGSSDPRTVQDTFFRSTFQIMGHVAKADGHVSETEIRAARAMMTRLRLGEADVRLAMDLFTSGKARDFPLDAAVTRLREVIGNRTDLRRMFVQIQMQAALWGSGMGAGPRAVVMRVCDVLGVSPFEFAQMEALLRMQQASGYGPQGAGRGPNTSRPQRDVLQDAYSVLGVAATATDAEVTKAYRRLMSQNHPDKLAANGLPESMKTVAEEKTRQIRAAYESIRAARGMK